MRKEIRTYIHPLLLLIFLITVSVSCITPSRLGISYKGVPVVSSMYSISDNPNITLAVNSLTKKDPSEDITKLKSRFLMYVNRNIGLTELLKNNPDAKIEMDITPSQITNRTYILDLTFFYPGFGILWPLTPWWGSVNLDANFTLTLPNKPRKEYKFIANQHFSIISYPYYRAGKILTKKYSSLYADLFEQVSKYEFRESLTEVRMVNPNPDKSHPINVPIDNLKDTTKTELMDINNKEEISTNNLTVETENQSIVKNSLKEAESNKPVFRKPAQSVDISSSSITVGIAGHDLLDAWFRLKLNGNNLLMAGFGYKIINFDRNVDRRSAYTASMGWTHYYRKISRINKKDRLIIVYNGLYFLGGYSFGASLEPFGQISQTYLSTGSNIELLFGQKQNQSIALLLGPCFSTVNSNANFYYKDLEGHTTKSLLSVYGSIQYNLYFKSNK